MKNYDLEISNKLKFTKAERLLVPQFWIRIAGQRDENIKLPHSRISFAFLDQSRDSNNLMKIVLEFKTVNLRKRSGLTWDLA